MEFVDTRVYLDSTEKNTTRWPTPITITSESLAVLSKDIQHTVEDINEMMGSWDLITHSQQIDLTIARNRLNCRAETYKHIARYAAKQIPGLFTEEIAELTPESFLELTK